MFREKHFVASVKNIVVLITILIVIAGVYTIVVSVISMIQVRDASKDLAGQEKKQGEVVKEFDEEKIYSWKYASLQYHGDPVGNEQYSGKASDPNVPNAPTEMQVIDPQYGKTLQVYWKDPEKASLIRIYRATSKGVQGTQVAEIPVGREYYIDSAVENGTSYYYTLKSVLNSVDNGMESTNTKQIFGTPTDVVAPPPPTNVSILSNDNGSNIALKWINPSVGDFAVVSIYRSEKEGEVGSLLTEGLKSESYNDENIRKDVEYYYTLTAKDIAGNESLTTLPVPSSGKLNPFSPSPL